MPTLNIHDARLHDDDTGSGAETLVFIQAPPYRGPVPMRWRLNKPLGTEKGQR